MKIMKIIYYFRYIVFKFLIVIDQYNKLKLYNNYEY